MRQEHVAKRRNLDVVLIIREEDFDDVRVAVGSQPEELLETEDRDIGFVLLGLFKVLQVPEVVLLWRDADSSDVEV